MYQNVKHTCRVLFWLINPIVLWRSRCRRRRRCLSSLVAGGIRRSFFAAQCAAKTLLRAPAMPPATQATTARKTSLQNITFRYSNSFVIIPVCLICKMQENSPRTALQGTVLK